MKQLWHLGFTIAFAAGLCLPASAVTGRYRITWQDDPATTMVIGWDQISGHSPIVYLDEYDYGQEFSRYRFSKPAERLTNAKGMNNHFVNLRGLKPNTTYYFVIRDSEGISRRLSFQTAPNYQEARLSIIAGGDSRNNREARQDANSLVGKLRPHLVLFNGDMTDGDTPQEWKEWFDDWQLTISPDGHVTPIVVARGNHEASNESLVDLFNVRSETMYYALTFCGGLLRIYTLNSLIPAGGNQRDWLERDLGAHTDIPWKIAQYHHTMRPHTSRKPENNELYVNWAPLFYGYKVNLVMESDAHVVKTTWPIKPSSGPQSFEGFERDDVNGTVYAGEGGWGAPLRDNNDDKPWTRNSGSFNQFKWIFVDQYKIEVRVVRTDGANRVRPVDPRDIFTIPYGLAIWNPSQGDVVTIRRPGFSDPSLPPQPKEEILAVRNLEVQIQDFSADPRGNYLALTWATQNEPRGMRYELERSTDNGRNFVKVAEMDGKGQRLNNYECLDMNLSDGGPGAVKYRIKKVFPDGSKDYFLCPQTERTPPVASSYNVEEAEDIDEEDPNNWDRFPRVMPEPGGLLRVAFELPRTSNVHIRMINPRRMEVTSINMPNLESGLHVKSIDTSLIPPGQYLLVVRANGKPLRRFRVLKR